MKSVKTVILDSNPLVSYRFDNSIHAEEETFGRRNLQPLLGKLRSKYSHFVPLQDSSEPIKKLLEIPETEVAQSEPVKGFEKILEAEKVAKYQDSSDPNPSKVVDKDFVNMAKTYVNTAPADNQESYEPPKQTGDKEDLISAQKNDGDIGNIVEASQESGRSSSRVKGVRKSPVKHRSKKVIKKPVLKKKLSRQRRHLPSFCIVSCKK